MTTYRVHIDDDDWLVDAIDPLAALRKLVACNSLVIDSDVEKISIVNTASGEVFRPYGCSWPADIDQSWVLPK